MPEIAHFAVKESPFSNEVRLADMLVDPELGLGFYLDEFELRIPNGSTLACIVVRDNDLGDVEYIDLDQLDYTVLSDGDFVTATILPGGGGGGGGGKNFLGIILLVAAFAVSFILPGLGAFAFLGKAVFAGFSLTWGQVIGFGLMALAGVIGMGAKQSLKAPTIENIPGERQSDAYNIQGTENKADRYGPVRKIFGKTRVYPVLAASPFTDLQGDDQYFNILFNWGYGPIAISAEKLGETLLTEYEDVQLEHRNVLGKALVLAADLKVDFGTRGLALATDDLSIGLWLLTSDTTSVDTPVLQKGDPTADGSWAILMDEGKLKFSFWAPGAGAAFELETSTVIADGEWHFFTITVDRDGNCTIYQDGAEDAQDDVSAHSATFAPDDASTLVLGANSGAVVGKIDGIRIYVGSVLTEAQHVNHWDNEFTAAEIAAATAILDFDDDTLTDYSQNGHNGTVESGAAVYDDDGQTFRNYPLTLYTDDVWEESLNVEIKEVDGWKLRTTQVNTEEIGVMLAFPQGLALVPDRYGASPTTVELEVQYSESGANDWYDMPWDSSNREGFEVDGKITCTAASTTLVRFGGRAKMPYKAQFDVRVRRLTEDNEDDNTLLNDCAWYALQSVEYSDPVLLEGTAQTALRIKASGQLQGTVDEYNAIAESMFPIWDDDLSRFRKARTRNPADCYIEVLRGRGQKYPRPQSRLDFDSLLDFRDFCTERGFNVDAIVDFRTTVFELLQDIAGVARAEFALVDTNYAVSWDREQTAIVQTFTPHNLISFEGEIFWPQRPHGWRVRFINAEADYQQDEALVYSEGYDVDTANDFEEVSVWGIQYYDHIWRWLKYLEFSSIYRPENFYGETDMDHLVCSQGDRCRIRHYLTGWGLGDGKVRDADVNGVILDQPVTMEPGLSYAVGFRSQTYGFMQFDVVNPAVDDSFATDELDFQSAIDPAYVPAYDDLWAFGLTTLVAEDVVVRRIESRRGWKASLMFAKYAPDIYNLVDNGTPPVHTPNVTRLPDKQVRPPKPQLASIRSDENVVSVGAQGELVSQIVLTFKQPLNAQVPPLYYEIKFRQQGSQGPYKTAPLVPAATPTATLSGVNDAITYDLRVTAIGRLGQTSEPLLIQHTVVGQTSLPPTPDALYVELLPNGNYRYRLVPGTQPIDVIGYRYKWRLGSSVSWDDALPAFGNGNVVPQTAFEVQAYASGTFVVMAKAVDRGGRESAAPAYAIVNATQFTGNLTQDSYPESAEGFPATKTNSSVVSDELVADAADEMFSDPMLLMFEDPDDPMISSFDAMQYLWSETFTTAGFAVINIVGQGNLTVEYQRFGDLLMWEGSVSDGMFTDPDDPMWSATEAWLQYAGPFKVVAGTEYHWRVSITGGTLQGKITALSIDVNLQLDTELLEDVSIDSAGGRLPITRNWSTIRRVTFTLQSAVGYDAVYVKLLDKDPDLGPLVQGFDASGVAADALVDATIDGILEA